MTGRRRPLPELPPGMLIVLAAATAAVGGGVAASVVRTGRIGLLDGFVLASVVLAWALAVVAMVAARRW